MLLAASVCPAWAEQAAAPRAAQAPGEEDTALPPLVLDGLPPGVRASLETAYAAAGARPRSPAAVGRLAMMLHAYEQYRAASGCYRIAQQGEPRSAAWPYLRGVVDAELGAHAAAADLFRTTLLLDPEYLPARIRRADALMRLGDLRGSHDEYVALTRDFPELALAHYGLGRLSTVRAGSSAAVAHYQRALELAPEFGAAHYALALAYRDAGSAERAEPHLEAYRRFGARRPVIRDPLMERVRSLRETARDLLAEAARLWEAGKLDASIALQQKALELDPETSQAHVNLISLYGRTGARDKAREHYEAALRLDGSVADAHYNYGVLLASERRESEAADVFRKALEVDPFHPAAHNNLAALLARQGRYEEAARHYRQTLANDPQHGSARLNLGRVLVRLGRPQEAAGLLRQALERAERIGDATLSAAIRRELAGIIEKR
jgi:tetratricopeptide (TPR) repeat protein